MELDPRVLVVTDATLVAMLGPGISAEGLLQEVWDVRTMEDIESAVRKLPIELVAKLALGPLEEPDCRLCKSIKEEIPDPDAVAPEVADAGVLLLNFHEFQNEQLLPFMMAFEKVPDYITDLAHRFIGTLIYTRCQLIYSAAQKVALAA